jgi:MSHA biogenesis protein MshJ
MSNKSNDKLDNTGVSSKQIFKHSVEITIGGSYNDLLAYLSDLENIPQRLLWNSVELNTENYPRNKMTIVVYTLSFDRNWLSI